MVACDHGAPVRVSGAEGPVVVSTDPPDGAVEVPRRGRWRVRFDRALDPTTVHRGTVGLRSGPQRLFLSVRVDPIDRAIVVETFSDQALEPGVFYRITAQRVRDLDGRSMAEPFSTRFETGDDPGAAPARPSATWAEVEPVLAARCAGGAGGGCHGGASPALGLDLSSAEGVARTAVGVAAQQVEAGVAGSEGTVGAPGLTGLPIIDALGGVGRPETSYLVYKVIGEPHILGEVMPPAPADPLDEAELRTLSEWIRAGASTPDDN